MVTVNTMNGRLDRVRQAMIRNSVSLLFVAPSSDLVYLCGYEAHASERPTLLVVDPETTIHILVPQLEAPRVQGHEGIQVLTYSETHDPFDRLVAHLGDVPAAATVAISDQAWARVLLGLERVFPHARFIPASHLLRESRMHKSEEELESLTQAGSIADAVFEQLIQLRFAGQTERSVARSLKDLLREGGLTVGEGDPIVASGPNSASPHHMTGEREIHEGDAVVLDFGGTVDRYHADITRTVHVGTPDDEFRHVYEVVRTAQEAGVQAARPGVTAESVDNAAREVIRVSGNGHHFVHRTGHGIGLDGHEEPYIVSGNTLELQSGMTFSIEPGIYLPGRFGVRIEDIVALEESGARRLNNCTRDLVIVH